MSPFSRKGGEHTMYKLKMKDKEYEIKFGYKPTLKANLISRMIQAGSNVSQQGEGSETLLQVEEMLLLIPEIILVGLQKNHKDEFGYDYDTGEGKTTALDKVFDMMDDYFEEESADILQLYNDLQNEMLSEGFLKSMFQREMAEQKKANKKNTKKTPQN